MITEFELDISTSVERKISPVSLMNSFNELNKIFNNNKEIEHVFVNKLMKDNNFTYLYKYAVPCVYIYYNKETNYFYIGSGDRDRRRTAHINTLKNGTHANWKFRLRFSENSNFEFYYIITKSRKEALAFEQTLLDIFHSNEFNLNIGKYVELGNLGLKDSDEVRNKKRIARLKFSEDNPDYDANAGKRRSGERNGMHGRKHSLEVTKLLGRLSKKRHAEMSVDEKTSWRNKLSLSRIGNKNSLNHKQTKEHKNNVVSGRKLLTKKRGYYHSPETIEKIKKSNTGAIRSDATREKLRLAGLGKKLTITQVNKMHDGLKLYFERNKIRFVIDNIIYNSITDIMEKFSISKRTVYNRLANDLWVNWNRLEED